MGCNEQRCAPGPDGDQSAGLRAQHGPRFTFSHVADVPLAGTALSVRRATGRHRSASALYAATSPDAKDDTFYGPGGRGHFTGARAAEAYYPSAENFDEAKQLGSCRAPLRRDRGPSMTDPSAVRSRRLVRSGVQRW